MSRQVWKWELQAQAEQYVIAPTGTEFLSVAMQGDDLVLWGVVDTEAPTIEHLVAIRGTGHDLGIAEKMRFIGTVLMFSGRLVWHVFVPEEDDG